MEGEDTKCEELDFPKVVLSTPELLKRLTNSEIVFDCLLCFCESFNLTRPWPTKNVH